MRDDLIEKSEALHEDVNRENRKRLRASVSGRYDRVRRSDFSSIN